MICRFVLFRQKWHDILLLISKIRFRVSPVSPASLDTKNAALPLPVWKEPEKRRFAFFYFSPRRIAKPVSGKVMATMGRK